MTKQELIKKYKIKASKIDCLFDDDKIAKPLKRIYIQFINDLKKL